MKIEIDRAFRSFCEATGLQICLKIFQSNLIHGTPVGKVHRDYRNHISDFCLAVKRTQNDQCRRCDLQRVPALCKREKDIFLHTCHAGAGEMIVPLFEGETLAAVIFIGQFHACRGEDSRLRHLNRAELGQLRGLAVMLRAYLLENMHSPVYPSETAPSYRDKVIRGFIKNHIKRNPALSDLARHMGISTTRAGHVVREVTGCSFVTVRDSYRLEYAQNLLARTYLKVTAIAAECGFSSPHYFHRFFRRHTGLTPLLYRKQHRAEA